MDKKLAGKVALVTGASRGNGRTIAEYLANHGAKVVINFANRSDQAADVVQNIKGMAEKPQQFRPISARLNELERLYQETIRTFGKLDIVVNNGGSSLQNLCTMLRKRITTSYLRLMSHYQPFHFSGELDVPCIQSLFGLQRSR
ncbi:SDR family NAD(P)-dependent oxidoreductase [Paenibacillus lautus]|uniref:SDR family NAD(P)-dependent oxidoreductase n=1 Tax=Paenibacillus lautus TaxID=1401 RepID=UPI0020D14F5D|nr:SDR family NAD(P)-dependent oxidoreductase [Paenibacillus lautus]